MAVPASHREHVPWLLLSPLKLGRRKETPKGEGTEEEGRELSIKPWEPPFIREEHLIF